MTTPPRWFVPLVAVALLWNLVGLFAVFSDMRLAPAAIAALPPDQQAIHAARPLWSIVASVVAVVAGTIGCIGLLMHRRWAVAALAASLAGVVLQDVGLFVIAGAARLGPVPVVMQAVVLLVAVGLLVLARRAAGRSWLA